MTQPAKVRERIHNLDERLARLRAEKSRLVARASQSERRRDTRRKILIGGAILAAIDHEGVPTIRTKAELLAWLDRRLSRPHDRAVFGFAVQESVAADGGRQPSAVAAFPARSDAPVKEAAHQPAAPPSGAKRP